MRRREFVAALGATATVVNAQTVSKRSANTGRVKQCAMRATFDPKMPFEDWPTLRKYGLIPTMGPNGRR